MNWYAEKVESGDGNSPIILLPTPGLKSFVQLSVALGIVKSHSGNFTQGQTGATFQLVVTNTGGIATSGTITVTEMVPAGLTFVSMSGTGWTVAGNVATRSDSLLPGHSYDPLTITVNVASDASSPLVNQVGVSGDGATAVASDSVIIDASGITPTIISHTVNQNPYIGVPAQFFYNVQGVGNEMFLVITAASAFQSFAPNSTLPMVVHGSLGEGNWTLVYMSADNTTAIFQATAVATGLDTITVTGLVTATIPHVFIASRVALYEVNNYTAVTVGHNTGTGTVASATIGPYSASFTVAPSSVPWNMEMLAIEGGGAPPLLLSVVTSTANEFGALGSVGGWTFLNGAVSTDGPPNFGIWDKIG